MFVLYLCLRGPFQTLSIENKNINYALLVIVVFYLLNTSRLFICLFTLSYCFFSKFYPQKTSYANSGNLPVEKIHFRYLENSQFRYLENSQFEYLKGNQLTKIKKELTKNKNQKQNENNKKRQRKLFKN